MPRLWKIAPAFLLAFALVLAMACGGGDAGEDDATEDTPDRELGEPSEPIVSSASELFGPSVERFREEIHSFRFEYVLDMQFGGEAVTMAAEGAFQYPDGAHVAMEISGVSDEMFDLGDDGRFEMLFTEDAFYMYAPWFGGWFVIEGDELGDALVKDSFDPMEVINYESLVDALYDEFEDLGEVSKDGGTYHHYRVTIDMEDCLDVLMESFSEAETIADDDLPRDIFVGPMVMDFWVHPGTMLPYVFEAGFEFEADGETFGMDFSMKFTDYNERIELPAPPEDARSIEELFEEMFGDIFNELEWNEWDDWDPADWGAEAWGDVSALNIVGSVMVFDNDGDGLITSADGEAVVFSVTLDEGSGPVPMTPGWLDAKFVDAAGAEHPVSRHGWMPLSSPGDEVMEHGEAFQISLRIPDSLTPGPGDAMNLHFQGDSGVMMIFRQLPDPIQPVMDLR